MELVLMELDAGAELDATECAEVTSVGYQNTRSTQQGVKYGTLHICTPTIRGPKSTQTANSISLEPCGEALGTIVVSSENSPPRLSPYGVIKGA
jgi:hypothetical protein